MDYSNDTVIVAISATDNNQQRIIIMTNLTNDDTVELTETFSATFELQPARQLSLSGMSNTRTTFVILDDDGETTCS